MNHSLVVAARRIGYRGARGESGSAPDRLAQQACAKLNSQTVIHRPVILDKFADFGIPTVEISAALEVD